MNHALSYLYQDKAQVRSSNIVSRVRCFVWCFPSFFAGVSFGVLVCYREHTLHSAGGSECECVRALMGRRASTASAASA